VGEISSVPLPVPLVPMVRSRVWIVNVAVTLLGAVIVTLQVEPDEELHPDHPVKFEPVFAAAVNCTDVLAPYSSEQSPGQLIPGGALVTLPLPVPDVALTLRVYPMTVKLSLRRLLLSL
jgi:hypothetical protein